MLPLLCSWYIRSCASAAVGWCGRTVYVLTIDLATQLLDLNEILQVGTQIAAGFLDVAKCNLFPTLTGQACS